GDHAVEGDVGEIEMLVSGGSRTLLDLRIDASVVESELQQWPGIAQVAVDLPDDDYAGAWQDRHLALRVQDVSAVGRPVDADVRRIDLLAQFRARKAGVRGGAAGDRAPENHRSIRPGVKPGAGVTGDQLRCRNGR